MAYYKLLQQTIAKTNFTQEEIAQKCIEFGVTVSRSYIGRLLNGKSAAPNEEISRAIAKVCGVDERLLVIEGYLAKAPKEIREAFVTLKYVTTLSGLNMIENKIDNNTLNQLKEFYRNEPLSDFIISLIDNGNVTVNVKEQGYEFKSENDNLIFNYFQPINIQIQDNAMYPLIKENDYVAFEIKDKYQDSDILLVKFENEENITARQSIFFGNEVKLVPLNNKYQSKLVHIDNIDIIGKVKKVITEI